MKSPFLARLASSPDPFFKRLKMAEIQGYQMGRIFAQRAII
jgi:hypothetical protein